MKKSRGFGVIAALVVLVMLAALAAAIVALGNTQQSNYMQDALSARARQTARSGAEYGLNQAINSGNWNGAGACTAANPRNIDLVLNNVTGFDVTVTCTAWSYNEGLVEQPANSGLFVANVVTIFRIVATACPTAPCPQNAAVVASPGYVERTRVVIATN